MNIFSYVVKVNATLRPCSIPGVADYFFGSTESLDSTDAAQALAASAFRLRHDMGTGNTVTKWSWVSSGTGMVLEWPYPSNTTPVFMGLCVLYGYCTLHVFTL